MGSLVVDTHVLLWHFLNPSELSPNASRALRQADVAGNILISTISIVEIRYLVEKGKFTSFALDTILETIDDPTTALTLVSVDRDIAAAIHKIPRSVVPDMPDRIIAATAVHLGLPLVTCDEKIQASGIATVW